MSFIINMLSVNVPISNNAATAIGLNWSTSRSYLNIIKTYADGSKVVEGYIVLSEIPEDLLIYLTIRYGGLMFDDGTSQKIITAADFDENGVYRFRFLLPV